MADHGGVAADRPLRVLHLVCSDSFAGVERYLSYTAPALKAAGVDVTVAGGQARRMRPILQPLGIEHLEVATPRDALRLLSSGALRRRPPDLVHVHMTEAEVAAALAKPLLRRPVISTLHFARARGRNPLLKAAWSQLPRFLDGQVAISEYVAHQSAQRCVVVPTGVPDGLSAGGAAGATPRQRTVLVAQRFEPEKQTAAAIEAWASSGLGSRGWRLRLAGEGSEETALRRLATRRGVDDTVEFCGFVPELGAEMWGAGILLATTPIEGFGITVVEAMSCELPVAAAAAGGHLETVGPVSRRYLFDAGDPVAAGRVLRDLADDDEGRARYGAALRRRFLDEYTADRHAQRLADYYRTVVGGRRHTVSIKGRP